MLVGEFAPALRLIAWSQRKETYIACHHFYGAALLVLLVDPVADDELSFDIDPRTLPQVCAYRFRKVSPHLNPVPRSLFLPLAQTVFVRLLGSQRKIRHDLTAFGMPHFGIPQSLWTSAVCAVTPNASHQLALSRIGPAGLTPHDRHQS